ncbi:uncharacterized protein LOC114521100 [Dendronephthya gigantea]|uniref:uncharacterized protein LOC114521100 n=1 Tax=Dendronephthya gigantea TaxID=151771 RepID=UPI001068DE66|nr:uncharacterized protein LOC114521100 [Dendronephthya gigantea]
MNIGGIIAGFLVLLSLAWHITCKDTYDIPVAINALIQDPDKVDETEKFFYDQDKDFYSKVTPFDVAKSLELSVEDTISKKIKIVFLTFASSHVGNPLSLKDLKYTTKSNWSYTISVKSILNASNGELVDINGQTVISKIQENAMKVLGKRYQFKSDNIRNKLGLGKMAYLAADEKIWIKVVGIIVENVTADRNEALNLTTCYLAEMIGKTVSQIQKFTLNEVDMYLYNTTKLLEKLPEYSDNVIIRLYQTFNIMPTFLARISNTELSKINAMMMKDVLNLFTNSVLKSLRVNANEISEKDSSFDPKMLLSCTDKWEPFKTIIISESFQNSAEAMSVETDILSALINISYSDIQEFTITVMMNTLETVIDPLSQQKELMEATNLSAILQDQGSDKINTLNESVFNVIYSRTNFTEHQLGILYEWTSNDYLFSSMFTLEETNDVCKINTLNYVLLALARLTVGQDGVIPCKSFEMLREIWRRKSLNYLESKHSKQKQLSLHSSISMLVNQLTDASFAINYRVLNVSSETEKLISQLSINNITAITTYSSSYLKTKSFQDIIEIIVHLKRNGSFDREVTRGRESTTLSSVQSSTLLAPPMLPTSTLVIADKMSLTKYPSTTSMFPTSTAVNQVAYSSNIPSHSTAPIEPRVQNSSLYLSTSVLPASPTGISTTLISSISLVKPTTTKTETITSSIQKSGSKCQPECKTGELCILDNQNTVSMTCKDAKNLEGRLRITSGANFTVQLTDKTSEAFKKFSIQVEILIDSICKRSQYKSTFLGSEVLRFESGSIIVHYKLSFDSKLDLSSSTVEDIEQVFRNAQDTNFTIDNSSIAVEDYDECSTGKATKCYKTATCNNTLGSYVCICPKGSTGDGSSCRVANTRKPNDKEDVPWIIYVVIAIMVVLIIFLIVVIIYCEKKHKKKQRPQVLDFHHGGINMYPRSTPYLAQTPESEADLADGFGIVNRHGPQLNMVTFNPTPEDKKELELQKS